MPKIITNSQLKSQSNPSSVHKKVEPTGADARTCLSDLAKGEAATITGYRQTDPDNNLTIRRLFELGLMPGEKLLVSHKSPFGGTPLAVQVLGTLIGLSRQEADLILVERSTP